MANSAFLHQLDGGRDRFPRRNNYWLTHDVACCLSTATKDFIERKFTVKVHEPQPLQWLQCLKDPIIQQHRRCKIDRCNDAPKFVRIIEHQDAVTVLPYHDFKDLQRPC